jgi:hypothetical protein
MVKEKKGKAKEADQIKLAAIPKTATGFRAWRNSARCEVTAASGRGDEAFAWILEAEAEGASFEKLASSGDDFKSLDIKLASSLAKLTHDELGRTITLATEREAKDGRLIKGRQISRSRL